MFLNNLVLTTYNSHEYDKNDFLCALKKKKKIVCVNLR